MNASYGIPYFYDDIRFTDWMCVHNSKLPDDVVAALQMALDNYISYDMIMANPELASLENEEFFEWYEIALERLYGLQ